MTTFQPAQPIRLYRHVISGHAHRVELFLSLLGLPFESIDIDLASGAHKQPEFLKINPFGQLPAIDDNGVTIADSNAILVYLAMKYADSSWLPTDPAGAARVQRWLSVAAGQIAYGPATARLVNIFGAKLDKTRAQEIANNLFKLMESHLTEQKFLVGGAPTIADVASYAYIARAPEGDISLQAYPQIRSWLTRIEQLPGFVPMVATKVGLAA
jgi:glutathione S-transferase